MSALSLLAQSHQLDMTTGYNYQNSDQGQGIRASLHGWFADLQYDLTEHFAVTAEVDSYYGHSQAESVRQQNFVVGPQFTFRNEEARLRPLYTFNPVCNARLRREQSRTHSTCKLAAVWKSSYMPESISRSRRQSITLLWYRVHRRIVTA